VFSHRFIKVTLFCEKHIEIFSKIILTYHQIAPDKIIFSRRLYEDSTQKRTILSVIVRRIRQKGSGPWEENLQSFLLAGT